MNTANPPHLRPAWVPWLVFGLGLSAWSVVHLGTGYRLFFRYSLEPYLEAFRIAVAIAGLGCCCVAPFLTEWSLRRKWGALCAALLLYAIDLFISTFVWRKVFQMIKASIA